MIRTLARDTSPWSDDVWLVDSTPVGCGCSRETASRSDLAGWAQYGYCASHSRYFWGLRLHLVCTPGGLPVMFAHRREGRRARDTARPASTPLPMSKQPARADDHRGQELLRPRVRVRPCRATPSVAAAGPQRGGRAGRVPPVQAAAAGHRVDQPDFQGAARPGTTRWQEPSRSDGPRPVPDPRAHSGDLAQRTRPDTDQAVTDRLRSLTATTPLGLIHLAAVGGADRGSAVAVGPGAAVIVITPLRCVVGVENGDTRPGRVLRRAQCGAWSRVVRLASSSSRTATR